jgi:hypothetical protein
MLARSSILYDGFELVILNLFSWEELYGGECKSADTELLNDEQQEVS